MKQRKFVVCLGNSDYAVSLETRKIYELVEDEHAAAHALIRVIDESGEDYMYPQQMFMAIDIPDALRDAFDGLT